MSLIIREATATDIPYIRQIAHATWPSAYGSILSKEQLDYMLQKMYDASILLDQLNQGHQFYLAAINAAPHGFAGISNEGGTIFKLNKLYVNPDTQKTGAGKALLYKAIDFAKENGGTKLILQVNRYNNAKDFYLKQGFFIQREEDFAIGNGFFMNDYVMELPI